MDLHPVVGRHRSSDVRAAAALTGFSFSLTSAREGVGVLSADGAGEAERERARIPFVPKKLAPLALAAACVTTATPATSAASAPAGTAPLVIVLSAQPGTTIARADLPRFELDFVVRNAGRAAVDPNLEASMLYVDGSPAKNWMITIGNGPRDTRWHALPPGDTLRFGYAFGDSLFRARGAHTLVLVAGTVRSTTLTVVVR